METVAALCRELTADRRTDGELLAAFTSGDSEAAFAELIRRHGPLVWGACRRLLPNPADAEDAFQAAFLVLVRRARRLTRTVALGPWLHRVAVWTARNVRRKNARRLAKQAPLPDHLPDPAAPPDADLKSDLDAALLALPARYRECIVLCHLQGFSRREAAERLGCAEGTLSAWLHRGLARLRARLRDLDPAKLPAVALAIPPALAASTAQAATASAVAGAAVPPAIHSLVEGVLHMFWVKKATAATVALFAVFALGVGVGVGSRTEYSAANAGDEKPAKPQPPAAPPPKDVKGELEREIKILREQVALLRQQPERRAEAEVAAAKLKALQAQWEQMEPAKNIEAGYVEITITGPAERSELAILEVPTGGTAEGQAPPGPLTTRDLGALATYLRRAKLDPTGPRVVRVVVEPQVALNFAAVNALTVCDEAGYKTVTFTGYVFGGGFARPLKPDQKGDAAGYKHYEAAERKAAELAKEIEEGLRRY